MSELRKAAEGLLEQLSAMHISVPRNLGKTVLDAKVKALYDALAHEQEAEPIGWTPEMDLIRIGDFKRTIVLYGMYRKHTIPLYTHPAPMRKLTEDVA